jgi:hypothetical protein
LFRASLILLKGPIEGDREILMKFILLCLQRSQSTIRNERWNMPSKRKSVLSDGIINVTHFDDIGVAVVGSFHSSIISEDI